jgi:tRNA(adenine34) deaminase
LGEGKIEEGRGQDQGPPSRVTESDEDFMRLALAEARQALAHDDVPIGAVVTRDGDVLGAAGNERELRQDPTAHAEILALRAAAGKESTWRLTGSTIYVTLEPCPMCAGAMVLARMDRLVYGPQDPRAGAAYSLYNIVQDPRLNHSVEIVTGVLAEESSALLRSFFEGRRRRLDSS